MGVVNTEQRETNFDRPFYINTTILGSDHMSLSPSLSSLMLPDNVVPADKISCQQYKLIHVSNSKEVCLNWAFQYSFSNGYLLVVWVWGLAILLL